MRWAVTTMIINRKSSWIKRTHVWASDDPKRSSRNIFPPSIIFFPRHVWQICLRNKYHNYTDILTLTLLVDLLKLLLKLLTIIKTNAHISNVPTIWSDVWYVLQCKPLPQNIKINSLYLLFLYVFTWFFSLDHRKLDDTHVCFRKRDASAS